MVITRTRAINVRCFKGGFFLSLLLLANRDRGANQHLRTISGAEIESEPSMKETLCQEDTQ